jgi:hypothetical protein
MDGLNLGGTVWADGYAAPQPHGGLHDGDEFGGGHGRKNPHSLKLR